MFRDLTRLSAAGIPTIALVFGNSTAGGAYIPGMSDHVVMIKERSKVFLAGPAAGEDGDRRGVRRRIAWRCRNARPHFGSGGLLRRRRARRHPDRPPHRRAAQLAQTGTCTGPGHRRRCSTPKNCSASFPSDLRVPFDPRDVIARIVDGSDFDEFKPLYGSSLVTGWATLYGYPIGILANAPRRAVQRGVAEGHAVHPAGQPVRHATSVPAQHHRLHGRQAVRGRRDDQARLDDDQRRCRTRPSRTSRC